MNELIEADLSGSAIGIVKPKEAFGGFSDDIVIIVGSALVLSAAMQRSGIIERAVASPAKTLIIATGAQAKWLGLEKMEIWDRNAPLPGEDDLVIPWDQARTMVMDAYGDFDPRMAELAEPFFDKGWIDAEVKPGKSSGAFAHPTVTNVHPYVMLNYLGKQRDVMTLAHELGHGVHQVLAAEQGELLADTPLTLAETASVFGEMLTFRKLLDNAPDQAARKRLLAGKVEDMINTVVRQIAFYDFE